MRQDEIHYKLEKNKHFLGLDHHLYNLEWYKLQRLTHFNKWPKGWENGQLELLGPVEVGTDDLEEIAAQDEDGVAGAHSHPRQADLQGRDEVLLEAFVETNANLLGEQLAD